RLVTIVVIIFLAIFGDSIGSPMMTTLGITANTSVIGAIFTMIMARIQLKQFINFQSIHTPNFILTAISAATFGAASSLMLPIGIPFVMGMPEMVVPLLIGVSLAMIVDAILLYKFFDSKVFPAKETWPPGIATAEAIKAGDE